MQANTALSDIEKIDHIIAQSTFLFSSALIIELLAALLLSIGVIMIFLYSKRPGRIMMFGGLLCYILIALPFLYFEMVDMKHVSNTAKNLILYLPVATSVAFATIAIGFVKFAWSFKVRN